ncbi:MAG: phage antirepressor protein, partial [Desulfobacteraceae bacterium]|nr:phage antirepressor protein [Desulfobacteraceae bacterium]
METSIAVFRGKEIRKRIHNDEWWFSVVDECAILTE